MKQETNNEIDLLLRRMGRRDGDSMGDADTTIDEGHLDADELSSYSQNALPPATRARYTEHLAECSPCRKLVTQLSLSLGSTAAAPVETGPASHGLKAFLAGLFSPMVLRYAVPALGLIVIAAIGVVVLRQQKSEGLVGLVGDQERKVVPSAEPAPSVTAPLPNDRFYDKVEPESKSPRKPSAGEPREAAPGRKTADTVGAAPAPPAKDQPSEAEPPRTAAATPAAAAPKVATVTASEAQKREDAAASKPEPVVQRSAEELSKERANKAARDYRRTEQPTASPGTADTEQAKAKPTPSDTRGFLGGVSSAGSRRRGQEDKTDAVTRSIVGRRFRNERGIWIDTEYDSSIRTVNMARGSEQFRALVADEPAIGTIAKQLDGEVIVVWKGRAYRIR